MHISKFNELNLTERKLLLNRLETLTKCLRENDILFLVRFKTIVLFNMTASVIILVKVSAQNVNR